jgi:hypothetical protein
MPNDTMNRKVRERGASRMTCTAHTLVVEQYHEGASEKADVTGPLTREDLAFLLDDGSLTPELGVLLEDPARTIELGPGYDSLRRGSPTSSRSRLIR